MTTEQLVPELYLVRWFDYPSSEALCEDRLHGYTPADFALLSNVFVATSVDDAKRIIEDELINDDCVCHDSGEAPTNDEFSWDDEHRQLANQYAVEFQDELVAIAYIEPLKVTRPTGGPQ